MSETEQISGLIIKAHSGIFSVNVGDRIISAKLRGRLMQAPMESDAAALGDRVRMTLLEDGTGAIEEIEERDRVLSRPAPGRPDIEQQTLIEQSSFSPVQNLIQTSACLIVSWLLRNEKVSPP